MAYDKTDMTTPPDLTKSLGTGAVPEILPVYQDFLPPCNQGCPAGENIQAWLDLAQAGRHEEAWQVIMRDNPMPAIHGRACYHPCEPVCNRQSVDGAVSIHAVERFLGDRANELGWMPKSDALPSGRKVLIIGAGPAGLSAAYHLRQFGHEVEIREAGAEAGGMMRYGIPAYRLPRNILDAEVQRLEKMGGKITLNHKVEDAVKEKQQGGFDAVFVCVGAHISKRTDIPARDASKVLDAVSFLRGMESGEQPVIGRRVAIYGGGNTAMDAARTAKRLGATDAMIIYRRDREHMPAHDFEAVEAEEEGVKINWLSTIKEMDTDATTITIERMELDENGRPQPTGVFDTLQADSLILALGQDIDSNLLQGASGVELKPDGSVSVDAGFMTGHEGIFAGGDMVPDDRSITIAVGHGKKAARYINAYLLQSSYVPPDKHPLVEYEKLQLWYKTDADQSVQATLKIEDRVGGFDEVISGLTEEQAVFEAQRCYSCGNCFECDGCYGACPESAVIKLGTGNRYKYNYDLCIGCRACFLQCPCHAIEMVPADDARILAIREESA
ncbi:MAG: NAD(P)-binding protein [Pseudohongiella sp.]|nr:NAD(P)-binding protein [Pseudohongiella sp.]